MLSIDLRGITLSGAKVGVQTLGVVDKTQFPKRGLGKTLDAIPYTETVNAFNMKFLNFLQNIMSQQRAVELLRQAAAALQRGKPLPFPPVQLPVPALQSHL
jgi:hypothetical protein